MNAKSGRKNRMIEQNVAIKNVISKAGLKKYEVAHEVGVTDAWFSKMLRFELPKEKKRHIYDAIHNLLSEEEWEMISTDALADGYYVDRNPEFQDPDAYDVDEYLDKIGEAKEQIDNTLSTIENVLDIRHTKGVEKVKKLLLEAYNRLEEES